MPFTINEQEVNKMKKQLKTSYDMYEKTKAETRKKMKAAINADGTKKYTKQQIDERVEMIDKSEEEIIAKFMAVGGTMEELKTKAKVSSSKLSELDMDYFLNNSDTGSSEPQEKLDIDVSNYLENEKNAARKDGDRFEKAEMQVSDSFMPTREEIMEDTNFDTVSLPSKGECYRSKIAKLPVAYLNAFDENIITAPNLYRDNAVIDTILKRKIMNNTISCDEMLEGDRDAVILFLRATGFGTEYPITVTDNQSGKEFDTTINLSDLKYKPFNLVGDANGWFDFQLPVSKKTVKFRFLTHKDVKFLDKIDETENSMIKRNKIREMAETLDEMVDLDKNVSDNDRVDLRKAVNALNKWQESISENDSDQFTHTFTNALELSVMAVDNNTDRSYIRNFVRNMNIRDSSALNKYISENEPGIDYHITVQRPESLGGGSTTVFLQIDQYLFLNVSE